MNSKKLFGSLLTVFGIILTLSPLLAADFFQSLNVNRGSQATSFDCLLAGSAPLISLYGGILAVAGLFIVMGVKTGARLQVDSDLGNG